MTTTETDITIDDIDLTTSERPLADAKTSITYPATGWILDGADTLIARREVGGDIGAYTLARQDDRYYLVSDLGADQIHYDQTEQLREAAYYLTHDLDTGHRGDVEIVDQKEWEIFLQQIDEA